MAHLRFFSIFSVIIFCTAFVAAGCSNSSSPTTINSSNQSASVKPKIGSTFTDSISPKDTFLVNQPGSSETYTLTDTNATIGEKLGVYVFISTDGFDTLYEHFETNGDVAIYIDFAAGGFDVGKEWITLPFASQDSSSIQTLKAVVAIDTVTVSGYVKGTGTHTQSVAGTYRYEESATTSTQAVSALGTIPYTLTITYAPSLGLVIYDDQTQSGSALGQNFNGGSTSFLTSYMLK
jgi:hypothetical protein